MHWMTPHHIKRHIDTDCKGADEFKWAKIDVKTSTFLQFFLHLSMWCHFNGMWIMENCAYWIIYNVSNKIPISEFGLNKRCLTTSFNDIIFVKGPLIFIIQFISSSFIFYSNMVLLDTSKGTQIFIFFKILCLWKIKF